MWRGAFLGGDLEGSRDELDELRLTDRDLRAAESGAGFTADRICWTWLGRSDSFNTVCSRAVRRFMTSGPGAVGPWGVSLGGVKSGISLPGVRGILVSW